MEDGRWELEDGRRVWAVGGRLAHGPSPQPSLHRTEEGTTGIARRPVVLSGNDRDRLDWKHFGWQRSAGDQRHKPEVDEDQHWM